MKEKKIPLFDIYWDENDVESVSSVIKRGSFWAAGPEIQSFEAQLSHYFQTQYALTFNSGTSALHALLLACGINQGEVIVPSFSFISTANAVVLAGATPIFAEIEPDSFGLDPEDVVKKITPNTKAIMPMHYGGRICKNILKLRKIADEHKILLLEDNAESFGAQIEGKLAGTIGDAGMLSFCQNKIITTGEGGVIITNRKDIYEKLVLIRSHGRVEQPGVSYFENTAIEDYIEVGYNFRLPTMCAALGISQLAKIEQIIEKRIQLGEYYNRKLSTIGSIQVLPQIPNSRSVYQLYTIMLKDSNLREDLQAHLLSKGIYTKIYFAPIHLKSFYQTKYGYKKGDLPITENISNHVVSLPISLKFTSEERDYIVNSIAEFFQNQKN